MFFMQQILVYVSISLKFIYCVFEKKSMTERINESMNEYVNLFQVILDKMTKRDGRT